MTKPENIYLFLNLTPSDGDRDVVLDLIDGAVAKLNGEADSGEGDRIEISEKINYLEGMASSIRADSSILAHHAAQILPIGRQEDFSKIDLLRERAAFVTEGGRISPENLATLSEEFSLPWQDILNKLELELKKARTFKYSPPDVEPLDAETFARIRENLGKAGKSSLYDFLGVPCDADFDVIVDKSSSLFEEYSSSSNGPAETGLLCQIASKLLTDSFQRKRYDKSEALRHFDGLRQRVKDLKLITADQYRMLIAESAKAGFGGDMTEYYIYNYCKNPDAVIVEEEPAKAFHDERAQSIQPARPDNTGAYKGMLLIFGLAVFIGLGAFLYFKLAGSPAPRALTVAEESALPPVQTVFSADKKVLLFGRMDSATQHAFSHVSIELTADSKQILNGKVTVTRHQNGDIQTFFVEGKLFDRNRMEFAAKSGGTFSFSGEIRASEIRGDFTMSGADKGTLCAYDVSACTATQYEGTYQLEGSSATQPLILVAYRNDGMILGAARFVDGKSHTDYSLRGEYKLGGYESEFETRDKDGKKLRIKAMISVSHDALGAKYSFFHENRFSNNGSFAARKKQ